MVHVQEVSVNFRDSNFNANLFSFQIPSMKISVSELAPNIRFAVCTTLTTGAA